MSSFVEAFIKEQKDVEYCPYCFDERGNSFSCCHEVHFVKFCELSKDDQRYIAVSEYEAHLN